MFIKHWKKALFLSFVSVFSGTMAADFLLNGLGYDPTSEQRENVPQTQLPNSLGNAYQTKVPDLKDLGHIQANGLLVGPGESASSFSQLLYADLSLGGFLLTCWSREKGFVTLGHVPKGQAVSGFYSDRISSLIQTTPGVLEIKFLESLNIKNPGNYTDLHQKWLKWSGVKPPKIGVYQFPGGEETKLLNGVPITTQNVFGINPVTGVFFQGYTPLSKLTRTIAKTVL